MDKSHQAEYFEPFRKAEFRRMLARLQAPPGGRLLDVGASYGWMIQMGSEFGLDCFGIEPSPISYEPSLEDRIRCRTLEEHAAETREKYQVITLWHVLEHLRDPVAGIAQIRELLAENGIVVIAVPNSSGRMFQLARSAMSVVRNHRLMEELWHTQNENMHRWYFNALALECLFDREGICVRDSYTVEMFDWRRLWRRSTNAVGRQVVRAFGTLINRSRFTASETIVVFGQRNPCR